MALISLPFETQTEAQVAAQALLRSLIPGGQMPFWPPGALQSSQPRLAGVIRLAQPLLLRPHLPAHFLRRCRRG
jgi:hypothetical protein